MNNKIRVREICGQNVSQICLPDINDKSAYPNLVFLGEPVLPGQTLYAWMPGEGFRQITIERWEGIKSPWAWYISTDGYQDVRPLGLWCKSSGSENEV